MILKKNQENALATLKYKYTTLHEMPCPCRNVPRYTQKWRALTHACGQARSSSGSASWDGSMPITSQSEHTKYTLDQGNPAQDLNSKCARLASQLSVQLRYTLKIDTVHKTQHQVRSQWETTSRRENDCRSRCADSVCHTGIEIVDLRQVLVDERRNGIDRRAGMKHVPKKSPARVFLQVHKLVQVERYREFILALHLM